jgi:hypothetical protein
VLNDLKLLLGFSEDETDRDELLLKIIAMATARLKLLLGGVEHPKEMDHIVLDVSVIRFNRIGSEGMTAHSVEGEALSFVEDDFAQYADEIQSWLDRQESGTRGKVKFL